MLAAHDDKRHAGAGVASPTMPWGWGLLTIDTKDLRSAPVPPRVAARPVPGRHRPARGGRHPGRGRPPRLPAPRGAAEGRPLPAERAGRRHAEVDLDPDGRAGAADRARVAAAAVRPADVAQAPPHRRLHRAQGPGVRAGAVGEPGRLVARDDRRRDRGARVRGRHRAAQRRHGARRPLRAHGRPLGEPASRAGRRRPTARTPPSRTTCASPRTRSRTAARATRSATAARRARTSARSSTRASSSWCGSASSATTTR